MSEKKYLMKLKDDLWQMHLQSGQIDKSYKIMHDTLDKLLKSSMSAKDITKAFMNSRLDKFTTFKKRIYSLDIKWPKE